MEVEDPWSTYFKEKLDVTDSQNIPARKPIQAHDSQSQNIPTDKNCSSLNAAPTTTYPLYRSSEKYKTA